MKSTWLRLGVAGLGLTMLMAVNGCGGGGGDAVTLPTGTATIDGAGGSVLGEGGAQVVFPAKALASAVTVRIAKDGTGSPPLPALAVPAGAVYAITPHGGDFAAYAEVAIPVEQTKFADNEQLLLVTAEPGGAGWRVLSGATFANGKLRAPVMHFSFFQAIVIRDVVMPQLVTTIDSKNNIGADGATIISADYEFTTNWEDSPIKSLVARLTFPQANASVTRRLSAPQPVPCLPASYGHGGAEWRFLRNGSEFVTPRTWHLPYPPLDVSAYPRTEAGYSAPATKFAVMNESSYLVPGFGAVHFYGQDNLARGDYGVPNAATPTDVWALPPAGNNTADDLLTWRGETLFVGALHNGRMRIDVTVPTTCGLFIEAMPLAFRLNLEVSDTYNGLQPVYATGEMPEGSEAAIEFKEARAGGSVSVRWEFSNDPVNWQGRPMPAGVTASGPFVDYSTYEGSYYLDFAAVQSWHAGYYRAVACDGHNPTYCLGSRSARLVVRSEVPRVTGQPTSQAVLVGETTSFTVTARGAPDPTIQWQKRSLVAAGFGFTAWTNVDGADTYRHPWSGAMVSTYTTVATTMADNATQFRVVASNSQGSAASDGAVLSVLDQFVAPTVQSQPGNLNVVVGDTAVFAATFAGSTPMSYQWRRNGSNITGANSPVLTIANAGAAHAGRYDLVATNRGGSVTTDQATLVVSGATPVLLAPTIAAPPAALTVAAGNAANFAVAVYGSGPFSYQWTRNGVPIPGAVGASFGIAAVTHADPGAYAVRVTNDVGSVLSAAATLTVTAASPVPVAPVIVTAPAGLAVLPGSGATFAVAVTGTAPIAYQWRHDGVDIPGAAGPVLHLAGVTSLDAGQYSVVFGNDVGIDMSTPVTLIVIGAPAIAQQPSAASATEGATATYNVGATGSALRYQWTRNQAGIAGATGASYTTPALTLADSGAVYGVIVFNGAGLVFSQSAALTVTPVVIAPTVTQQPADTTITDGSPASFNVAFAGGAPFSVQMQRLGAGVWNNVGAVATVNDNNVASFATATLSAADTGAQYRFVASNASGSATTSAATVTVTAAPLITTQRNKVAAGALHTCAVRFDSTVACWGYNSSGQIGSGNYNNWNVPRLVAIAEGVVAVAAGGNSSGSSCALTVPGNLFCWGGVMGNTNLPTAISGHTGVRWVAVGGFHACLVSSGGAVFCWGNNSSGQLGDGSNTSSSTPVQVQAAGGLALSGAVELAAGTQHSCALLGNGSVMCWGGSVTGQIAKVVPGLSGVAALAAGDGAPCALLGNGTVACWGFDGTGPTAPTAVAGLANVAALASGSQHGCAAGTDGSVRCWGTGLMGNGNVSETQPNPTLVSGLSGVGGLAAGFQHTCALRTNGTLACWGAGGSGQLGQGDSLPRTTPTDVPAGAVFALP